MASSLVFTPNRTASRAWPQWPLHTFFAILFFGPIVAPLFLATGLPLISDSGALARDLLSHYVCPTPDRSYMLLGYPMAVCSRCWGATIGLWIAHLFLPRSLQAWFGALAWPLRLALCALAFLFWPLEIIGTAQGWWYPPMWLVLLNGVQAGVFAGIFFCSVWPGLWAAKHT